MRIDHVAIAAGNLTAAQSAYAGAGLPLRYGGRHGGGATEMAVLSFADGSYLELIAPTGREVPQDNPFWTDHLIHDGGPCGWAVGVQNIEAEVTRLSALGVVVRGPFSGSRRRPDDKEVRWKMAFLGDRGPGAQLPFLIEDLTPRELRVPPVSGTAQDDALERTRAPHRLLTGIAGVVLGVEDIGTATALFQEIYGWPPPVCFEDARFGARLAAFAGTPVLLASPDGSATWLEERLGLLGPSPCAYLLGSAHFEILLERFPCSPVTTWPERRLAWLDPTRLGGTRLGISQ